MYVKGWQANTTGEDVAKVLERFGAVDIVSEEGDEHPEFTWTSFVDCDEDLLKLLAITLWYNDRSDDDITAIIEIVREQLTFRGKDGQPR